MFIDDQFNKEEVERLIKLEMKKMEDEGRPVPNLTKPTTRDETRLNIKDLMAFTFPNDIPSLSKYYDEKEWERLNRNTKLYLENLKVNLSNLNLLIAYGPKVWNKFITNFKTFLDQLGKENQKLVSQCEEINQSRKFSQVQANEQLTRLKMNYDDQLAYNFTLIRECYKLRSAIRRKVKERKKQSQDRSQLI